MSASAFRHCRSATDLLRLAGASPASPPIGVILDALGGKRLSRAQARVWSELSPQRPPKERPGRAAICVGRRGLKTSGIVAPQAVYELLCGGHGTHAAAGSRVYAVVVAPRLAQAREAVRGVRGVLDSLAPLGVRYRTRGESGSTEVVVESPRSRVERVISIFAADAVAVRGYAICFAAVDEAAFLQSDDAHVQTDRDLIRALAPGMTQFPRAQLVLSSTPGPPQGEFHRAVLKPKRGELLVRAGTWQTNPRISEQRCRELADDDATFEQEFAARTFGYHNTPFIDAAKALTCVGSVHAKKGPRAGHFAVGLDVGQLQDSTAIVACGSFEEEIAADRTPLRHVVCEHIELISADRRAPTLIEAIAARAHAVSRAFDRAPIIFDQFAGPTVKAELTKLGTREHTGGGTPGRGTFVQASMSPQSQTPRWKLARQLVHGSRLHLPDTSEAETLARQLGQLRATQLGSGALKVEGRKDDVADAFALAAEVALALPPNEGPDGRVEHRIDGVSFEHGRGLDVRQRWVRVLPDGREVPAETPTWHPSFPDYAREMLASGRSTPGIERWLAARGLPLEPHRALDALNRQSAGGTWTPVLDNF